MKNSLTETSHESRTEDFDSLRVVIEVDGLPYVLEADVPKFPDSFGVTVSLPDEKWASLKQAVDGRVENDTWFAQEYSKNRGLMLGDGKVGSAYLSDDQPDDGAASISIDRIQSSNGYLPEGDPYYERNRIGSATLDFVCAIADARRWRIYAEPLERDGRLMGRNLNNWYARRGFKFENDYRRANDAPYSHSSQVQDYVDQMYSVHGGMMRLPQEPDLSNPVIAELLK